MSKRSETIVSLSPWWRHSVLLVMVFGFTILIWRSVATYSDAPPIPSQVIDSSGGVLFTGDDIRSGQEVFLQYGLMENGTIWGHGAYLGPDFAAEYLHNLSMDVADARAMEQVGKAYGALNPTDRESVDVYVRQWLRQNRYNAATGALAYGAPEAVSFKNQIRRWTDYFQQPTSSAGLPSRFIEDPEQLRQLTAFFAWAAWASVAQRPGTTHSYTNNFPFEPMAGNTPTENTVLWSALSLIALLGGVGIVLFAFGKFSFLGWKGTNTHVHPHMLPGVATESQQATAKFFVIVALLFLAQVLLGGMTAHYRADSQSFYGIDLSQYLPSNLARTWHLQLAIFWIATAYIAGGLLLAPVIGGEARRQKLGTNVLFVALVLVVIGSMFGEMLGINRMLGGLWSWFGHQGWEYLDLGRIWQVLLAIGLLLWTFLLFRAIKERKPGEPRREISSLFLYAAVAIPLFYLPAFFFSSDSNFSIVDTWRFWIIHLWVEGFFELFVTVMVAIIFFYLGVVSEQTAARVVYLDAILYLGSGIIGTGHHWYWTGQSEITMALAAMFSAMEVVPLTLLTLDAWDFVKLTSGQCDICGQPIRVPHRWTFYFLMAVGFWNFLGAGVFGFLINLPIVSYFEVGTILTPNHGHAAMMGVFGMLGVALVVFALRQLSSDRVWTSIEKYIRVSFWGLNGGLLLMVILNLFPGGVLQLLDVLRNGYWHARGPLFLGQPTVRLLEWLRLPADFIFIGLGVIPLVIAALIAYKSTVRRTTPAT
jgi:nitric oxide reductase subunit B